MWCWRKNTISHLTKKLDCLLDCTTAFHIRYLLFSFDFSISRTKIIAFSSFCSFHVHLSVLFWSDQLSLYTSEGVAICLQISILVFSKQKQKLVNNETWMYQNHHFDSFLSFRLSKKCRYCTRYYSSICI